MTDQQQRTQWALDKFRSFCETWTPPGAFYPSATNRVAVEDNIPTAQCIHRSAALSGHLAKREQTMECDCECDPCRNGDCDECWTDGGVW